MLAFCQLNQNNAVAESDGIERNCSVSIMWRKKTEEIIRDGAECGNYAISIDLNRLGGQTNGENEYIDMMFNGDKLSILEAKQRQK